MLEIIVLLIFGFIFDRIYKPKNDDYVIFEPSPNETAQERRDRKELEEYILYEDFMNNR